MYFVIAFLPNTHHACQQSSTGFSSFRTTSHLEVASFIQTPVRTSRYTWKLQIHQQQIPDCQCRQHHARQNKVDRYHIARHESLSLTIQIQLLVHQHDVKHPGQPKSMCPRIPPRGARRWQGKHRKKLEAVAWKLRTLHHLWRCHWSTWCNVQKESCTSPYRWPESLRAVLYAHTGSRLVAKTILTTHFT